MRLVLKAVLVAAGVATTAPALVAGGSDLRCRVQSMKPILDFEYRFVTGYWFNLPVKQFWGSRAHVWFEMVVQPVDGTPGEPVRIAHQMQAPKVIDEGIKGDLSFSHGVSVGPGKYRVDWAIIDAETRICRGVKKFEAKVKGSARDVELSLRPGEIVDSAYYLFRGEEVLERPHLPTASRLKIFVSLDVLGRRGRVTRTRLHHLVPLIAGLRQLARSQSFNEFSLVAFSFEDQRVVARHDYLPTVDVPVLRDAVQSLQPEVVDFNQLRKGSEMAFFSQLLAQELRGHEPPDGIVFLGRDVHFGKAVEREIREQYRNLGATTAFLDASRLPWIGAIGNLVRGMRGREFTLHNPSALARAVSQFEELVEADRPQ